MARDQWPEMRLKIKHRPSDKADLIQLADVAAYALQCHARASLREPRLNQLVEGIWRKEANRIWWGKGDDLRPYL